MKTNKILPLILILLLIPLSAFAFLDKDYLIVKKNYYDLNMTNVSNNYVPYSGAISDIDINSQRLSFGTGGYIEETTIGGGTDNDIKIYANDYLNLASNYQVRLSGSSVYSEPDLTLASGKSLMFNDANHQINNDNNMMNFKEYSGNYNWFNYDDEIIMKLLSGNLYVNGKIETVNPESPSSTIATMMYVDEDEKNSATSAGYLTLNNRYARLFLGSSSYPLSRLDFSNVNTIDSFPSVYISDKTLGDFSPAFISSEQSHDHLALIANSAFGFISGQVNSGSGTGHRSLNYKTYSSIDDNYDVDGQYVFDTYYDKSEWITDQYHSIWREDGTDLMSLDSDGNLNLTGDALINTIYAGMYLHNVTGVNIDITTQNQWYNFTNVNCGLLNGFSCDATTGTLTALYGGVYSVKTLANGEDGNNQIFEMGVSVNNVIQNNTLTSDETTSGIRTSMNGLGRILLTTGDKINLQLRDTSGTTTGTIYNMNILIDRVGN